MGLVEKRILLVSCRAFNSDAWERLYSIDTDKQLGARQFVQASRDIAMSADRIEQLTREIAEIEEAEVARHNARLEDDERKMRNWNR